MTAILSELRNTGIESFSSNIERKQAIAEAHALISRLETPWETSSRMVLTFPAQIACLKAALDLNLFRNWLQHNSGNSATSTELGSIVSCDQLLLERMLRVLASTNMIWCDLKGSYRMTQFTKNLITGGMACTIQYLFDFGMSTTLELPSFLAQTEYRNPDGGEVDYFKHSHDSKNMWEWLSERPSFQSNLNDFMKVSANGRGHFASTYPCGELSCEKDEALIVDIGGSLGHDLQKFRNAYPNASGRLILQDRPVVIDEAIKHGGLDPSIEAHGHDFFTVQSVHGARIYLLHAVLHDWPNAEAKRILDMVRPALKKGYSKLLINEIVIPEVQPDMESTSRDWCMMHLCSGQERTAKEWKTLVESAGFKIVKIWHNPQYSESIIETEAAEQPSSTAQ